MDPYVTQGGVLKSATSELENYVFNTGDYRSYMSSTKIYISLVLFLFEKEKDVWWVPL